MKINGKPDGGEGGAAVWGGITGNLSNQTDLMNKFDDYATESWVGEQGYLDSSDFKTINSQSIVGEGDIEIESLTPTQEAAVEVVADSSEGVLTNKNGTIGHGLIYVPTPWSNSTFGSRDVFTINGSIYGRSTTGEIYKFNTESGEFEYYGQVTGTGWSVIPIWCDNSGRVHLGLSCIINWDTLVLESWDAGKDQDQNMAANSYNYYNSSAHNIIFLWDKIYLVAPAQSLVFIYNEETGQFDSSVPYVNNANITANNFYRWGGYFNDGFDQVFVCRNYNIWSELVFNYNDGVLTSISFDTMTTDKYFPESFDADGTTISITAQALRPINGTEYWWDNAAGTTLYYLNNGVWTPDSTFVFEDSVSGNSNGAICGNIMIGFGYSNSYTGYVPLWNVGNSISTHKKFWDTSLATRMSSAESSISGIDGRTSILDTDQVPQEDGTYVLKATYNSGEVTYSWEADEVPQAVQITNEILS